jgi:hypothetical protein
MKKLKTILTLMIFFIISIFPLSGEMIKVKATGKSPQKITAKSKARIMALRAAKIVGYKKLAQAAGIGKYTKNGTKEYIEIEAFIKNAKITNKNYISDHEVEITMEMPLSDVIEKVSNFRKYRFNKKLLEKLQNKIEDMESNLAKIKTELSKLKGLLLKLKEISE